MMQINMNTNLNMNLEKKIVVNNQTLPEVKTQQPEETTQSQNQIAVHMTISQQGKMLANSMNEAKEVLEGTVIERKLEKYEPELSEKEQKELEEMQKVRKELEDFSIDSKTGEEIQDTVEEIKEEKERDYQEYVVTTDILEELSSKNADLTIQQQKRQQDLEIILESLGEGKRVVKDTEENKQPLSKNPDSGEQLLQDGSLLPEDRIEALKGLANSQATHVVNKAFDKEEKINDFLEKREGEIANYEEEILDANKQVARIDESIEERKVTFSEEEFEQYKSERQKEKGVYTSIIGKNKKYIKGELEAIREVKRARKGMQTMANANAQAEEIYQTANEMIMNELYQDVKEKIDNSMSKVERDFDIKEEPEEEKMKRQEVNNENE